jgi:hypothetical protein
VSGATFFCPNFPLAIFKGKYQHIPGKTATVANTAFTMFQRDGLAMLKLTKTSAHPQQSVSPSSISLDSCLDDGMDQGRVSTHHHEANVKIMLVASRFSKAKSGFALAKTSMFRFAKDLSKQRQSISATAGHIWHDDAPLSSPAAFDAEEMVAKLTGQKAALIFPESDSGLLAAVAALCRPIKHASQHFFLVPADAPSPVDCGIRAATSGDTNRVDYQDLDDLVEVVEWLGEANYGCYHSHVTILLQLGQSDTSSDDFKVTFRSLAKTRPNFKGMTILIVDCTGQMFGNIDTADYLDITKQASAMRARTLVFGSFDQCLGLNGAYVAGNKSLIHELRQTSGGYASRSAPGPCKMDGIAAALRAKASGEEHPPAAG